MRKILRELSSTPYLLLLLFPLTLTSCAGNVKLDTATITDGSILKPQAAVVNPVAITFSSYWEKDQRRGHRQSDIDDLKKRYTKVLTRTVEKALIKQGWTTATEVSTNAVIVNVAIDNMRITAPDFSGALVDLYSKDEHGSGDFTLNFERQGKTQAMFKDKRKVMAGAGGGQLNRTSRVMNQHAFDRALQRFIEDALKSETAAQ